uniref:T9SS type A sorting domain-containing protein n=2 Tax=Gelidibacter sp. TaxID=2018083 RepID=UPI00404A1C77
VRTWTATDDCGNETIHTQTISVEDTTNPTFNEALPSDITVECDAIPTAVTLTASDTCGSATVGFTESTSGTCDTLEIVRTWTATDDCGNETIHTQTISVEDTTNPTFNEALPSDTTVECDAIPTAVTLTASDTCGLATVDFSENTTGTCDTLEILRTWTATDDCGNETIHTQTISVEDTTNPVWVVAPSDMLVECSPTANDEFVAWLNSFSGTDTCGSASVSHNSSGILTCGNSATVTFTLTDACGNFITMDATFTIDDTLGLGDVKDEKLTLFPNPAFNYIIIKGLQQKATLTVYSLSGQVVWKTEAQNAQPVYFNLASGLYMLKIDTNNSAVIKKLIVE